MKKTMSFVAAVVACSTSLHAAAFTAGNLVVSRVGDGTTGLANSSGPISLLEFNSAGSLQQSVVISSNATTGLQISGSATSEGALSLSANGKSLTIAGYNPPFTGTGSLSSRTDVQAPRAYVSIAADGTVGTPVAVGAFSGGNIRSAVETTSGVYLAGSTTGTVYRAGGTNTTIQGTTTNTRVVNVQNGNLYYSTGSGGAGVRGIYGFTGTPTAGATPVSIITGVAGQGADPYDFAFSPDGLIAYVADITLGVQKFTYDGSLWSLAYNITTAAPGVTGLAVDFSGANAVIYAVNPGTLFSFVDLGSTGAMTPIATAGTNYAFRGLEVAPVPEPHEYAVAFAGLLFVLIASRRFKTRITA